MTTVLHGGGALGTPKYIICARPLVRKPHVSKLAAFLNIWQTLPDHPLKTGSCEWKNGPIPENPPSLHQKSKKFKTIFGDKGDVLTKFWPKKMIQSCHHRVIKNSLCRVVNDIKKICK